MKIGVFTAVCERDWQWVAQFKKQINLLDYDVAFFADKLSSEHLEELRKWARTVFVHDNQTEQFSERSKMIPFKALKNYDWAIQMDIDETWQDGAKELIEEALRLNTDKHIANCPMITVAKREEKLFQRTDKYFTSGRESCRERIYNLKYEWYWLDPITCGAKLFLEGKAASSYQPFECAAASVHWGYWTIELSEEHKQKWEEIWLKTYGRIPYTTYDMLSDRNYEFTMIPLEEKYYKHLCS